MKLHEHLRNEEVATGVWFCRPKSGLTYLYESSEVGYRRKMCAHARILALEEAIDTEWVYMWDKFGSYLLLLLGLAMKEERVQVILSLYFCFPCNYNFCFPFFH